MERIYFVTGIVVFWGVSLFVSLWIVLIAYKWLSTIYKRTWLCAVIDVFKIWWVYERTNKLCPAGIPQLKASLQALRGGEDYVPFRKWLIAFCTNQINRKKKELSDAQEVAI